MDDDEIPGRGSGDDAYEKVDRSTVENRSPAPSINSRLTGARSVTDDAQKLRSEYEYKIATMQMQISNLQRDLVNATEAENLYQDSEKRVKKLEEELSGVRQVNLYFIGICDRRLSCLKRAEEQTASIRILQKELEDLRAGRELAARKAEEDREELNTFRDRCNKLEEEISIQQNVVSCWANLLLEITKLFSG